jgi:hypothetical protein
MDISHGLYVTGMVENAALNRQSNSTTYDRATLAYHSAALPKLVLLANKCFRL